MTKNIVKDVNVEQIKAYEEELTNRFNAVITALNGSKSHKTVKGWDDDSNEINVDVGDKYRAVKFTELELRIGDFNNYTKKIMGEI